MLMTRNNLAGMIATILLHTGRAQDLAPVHAEILRDDREIRAILREFATHPEFRTIPTRFEPGDQIVEFPPHALDPSRPRAFADRLTDWVRTYQPGSMQVVTILRGDRRLTIPFYFPERTAEMRPLLDRVR
jgi:hypothetical protein